MASDNSQNYSSIWIGNNGNFPTVSVNRSVIQKCIDGKWSALAERFGIRNHHQLGGSKEGFSQFLEWNYDKIRKKYKEGKEVFQEYLEDGYGSSAILPTPWVEFSGQ